MEKFEKCLARIRSGYDSSCNIIDDVATDLWKNDGEWVCDMDCAHRMSSDFVLKTTDGLRPMKASHHVQFYAEKSSAKNSLNKSASRVPPHPGFLGCPSNSCNCMKRLLLNWSCIGLDQCGCIDWARLLCSALYILKSLVEVLRMAFSIVCQFLSHRLDHLILVFDDAVKLLELSMLLVNTLF